MSKLLNWRALDTKVLVVAVKRVEGTWCAYIGAVPGESHEEELQQVKDYGSKLSKEVADAVFRYQLSISVKILFFIITFIMLALT